MNDDTISPLDDAIVEDGMEETWTTAEQSAARVVAFYNILADLYTPYPVRDKAIELTIAWIRAGMP